MNRPGNSCSDPSTPFAGRVRSAGATDLPAIETLLEACGLPREGVKQALADFFLCEDRGGLLGAAGLEIYGADALLRSVAVRPDCRRQGIGTLLLGRCEAHARARRSRSVYLLTLDADEYFARFGYRIVDRGDASDSIRASAEFSRLCPASAVLMRRTLDGAP